MDEIILKLIGKAGFNEKESRVYAALLELGQGDIRDIAAVTGLKRSIIYVVLDGLIERGYANKIPDKKVNTYQAIDPSAILSVLKTTARNFQEMLPIMQTLKNRGPKLPKLQFIDTVEGIIKVYNGINYLKEASFVTSYARLNRLFPEALADWHQGMAKGRYPLKCQTLLSDESDEAGFAEKFNRIGQETRMLKALRGLELEFAIYDGKTAITSLADAPFMVLIESESLSRSMHLIFDFMWQAADKLA